MFDVRALPRVGPVAQRLEQGTHNPMFHPRRESALSHSCEHWRPKKNKNDRHTVNAVSIGPSLSNCPRARVELSQDDGLLEMELSGDLGFIRTRSHGTIVPKGQKPVDSEGNREIFIVKKIHGAWKFYRYIFNAEVAG
jgi:hypothetical protein